jgi:ankyrin repeat protein
LLPPEAHIAAQAGRLDELEQELQLRNKHDVLTERDENGWQILHSAISGGNPDIVKLLVTNGAEINARTHGGYGETPLRMAEKRLGDNSPIVKYLKGLGALSIGPEL